MCFIVGLSGMYTWSNLPSSKLPPTAPTSSRSQTGFENETHKHPNNQGHVIAASLSACKSSSWCNSHCNTTSCLHLQQLRRPLRAEALIQEMFALETTAMLVPTSVAGLDGGCDEIYNMFATLFKSNLHLHPWHVTSYESLSPSEPQSAPKAEPLWLAITPDEQGDVLHTRSEWSERTRKAPFTQRKQWHRCCCCHGENYIAQHWH